MKKTSKIFRKTQHLASHLIYPHIHQLSLLKKKTILSAFLLLWFTSIAKSLNMHTGRAILPYDLPFLHIYVYIYRHI